MHMPFHAEMAVKDEIARELLDDDATAAIDAAHADVVDIESRAGAPDFCNDERETDIDILTGDAE
jgi:hypothetical protein